MKLSNIDGHTLTLYPSQMAATCECGESLTATTYPALTKKWVDHVMSLGQLEAMADAVRREYAARAEGERHIMDLIAAGVATAKISEAIGYDGEALIMSPTTVQRIARDRAENPDKPPRRRRR